MNGFNRILIGGLLLLISCSQNVKQKDGEGLFLIYRGVPQQLISKITLWHSPQEYLKKESANISKSAQMMIQSFDKRFVVLRIGQINKSKTYKVDKIEYVSDSAILNVFLKYMDKNIFMDLGYPIFILNRHVQHVQHVQVFTNNAKYITINKQPLS